VAVSTGRSTGFAAALLGVLKAGGAYVPIDPAHPRELRDHFVRQAGAVAILTESRRGGGWADSLVPVLDIDAVPEFPNTNPETNLGVQASLGSLAYVLYTSGSTGRPKGVAIEHRSLSNYVASMMEDLEIAEGSSFAFVSTIGADLGNTAIFPALCSGGCLHILGEELLVDGAAFFAYLAERQIDYLKIVPSHFAALAAGCERSFPMPRRALILGGEGASARWVERLLEEHPGCRIFNHYGPTETTVGVLTYGCDPAHGPLASATLPLRRPVAGTQIYLLDAFGRSVPQGFDGEVAIGGVCVAREYIGEPELTAERFVEQPGAGVLYRTGDRARQLANGDIELLGRQDRQVGVRGYRVELGHVESILREHPAVEQCIVLPVRKDGEVVYLAAYAACGRDSSGTRGRSLAAELDALARRKLPLYMTPQRYRILDRIPLTGNGKIDVARLEALDAGDAPAAVSALPRDAVEMRLSDLWAEVLGVETVGPQDDFFRLGGHSLLCVRLAGRIHEEFDRRVPLSAFLACRTVEQFAAYLREEGAAPHSLLIPIRPRGELAPLILLPGAGGSAVYFYFLARHLAAERPVWAIQGQGLDGAAPIPERIEEMAAQSIAAIRNQFDLSRPVCLAGHSLGGLVAFEMARQLCAQGIETAFLGVIDNAAPGQGATECEGWPPGRWLRHIALRLEKLYRVRLGAAQDSLTEEELIDRMLAASLLPLGTRKEYFRHFLDVYRANAMAAARYRPIMDALPVTLTLFRADEPDAELSGAPDGRDGASEDDALGWGKFVAPQPHLLTVPGTHITMLDEPHVQELARRIEQRLEHAVDNARDKRNGAALSSNGTIPIEPSLET